MDFHASFRRLSSFDPTRTGEEKYTRIFAANMIGDVTINMPADAVDNAITETQHWLETYARRSREHAEIETLGDGDRVAQRRGGMDAVNPRFVLRQWVLEELIADLESAGTEDIQGARRKLARVLDVSGHRIERD
jgi:uncharacterized protein YdiU (UPF0061 family)